MRCSVRRRAVPVAIGASRGRRRVTLERYAAKSRQRQIQKAGTVDWTTTTRNFDAGQSANKHSHQGAFQDFPESNE